jgi:hypothetical protein
MEDLLLPEPLEELTEVVALLLEALQRVEVVLLVEEQTHHLEKKVEDLSLRG